MPNFHVGTINAQAPTTVSVGTSSTSILADTPARVGVTIMNISSSTVYIGIANAPTLYAGITLMPNGGVWNMDEYMFTNQAISGIAHSVGSIVSVQEFIR